MPSITPIRLNGAGGHIDKNGIISITVPWEVGTIEDALYFTPPDSPVGLPIVDRPFEEMETGTFKVTLHYENVSDEEKLEETFELDYLSQESPIEAFPQIKALMKKYKGQLVDNQVIWPPTIKTDISSGFSIYSQFEVNKNPAFGISSYFDPQAVWRSTRGAKQFENSTLKSLGKIDTPRGNSKARPPNATDGRNWLKKSVKASWRGNVWQISEEWMLSGSGGWTPDLYSPRP